EDGHVLAPEDGRAARGDAGDSTTGPTVRSGSSTGSRVISTSTSPDRSGPSGSAKCVSRMDSFIVNVAVPSLRAALGVPPRLAGRRAGPRAGGAHRRPRRPGRRSSPVLPPGAGRVADGLRRAG